MTEVTPYPKPEKKNKPRRSPLGRWRDKVVERDGGRCRLCAYRGPHVSAHHLIFLSRCQQKYRTDPRNGLTLCNGFANGCHESVHQRRKKIPRKVLPQSVVRCLEEQGLRWIDGQPIGVLAAYFSED